MKAVTALTLLIVAVSAHHLRLLPGIEPVPGTMMGLGAGFDVKLERIRMPLYQYSYDYNQTWYNPYSKETYVYPDQTYLTAIARGKIIKEQSTYTEWHDYVKSVTSHFGLDVGLSYGGVNVDVNFEMSKSKVDEMIKGGVNNFALELRYLPIYQLDIWPDSDFNAHAKRLIDGLPNTIQSDQDQTKYNDFIAAMGTHYCVSAQFGGFLNFTSIFASSFYKRHTQEWVAFQIKLSLTWQEIKAGIDYGRNKSTDKLDQDYIENSYNETNCVGGSCFLINEGNYDQWVTTIGDYPGLIPAYMIMNPITDLVNDNPVKKATLKQQVINYLNKPHA